jgi:HK97 family phage major capsid protein
VDIDTLLELTREVSTKMERALELKQKAKAEGRELSRREQAEIDRVRREAKEISDRLPKQDGRQFQPAARSASRDEHEPELLRPSDSFAERVRERRGGFSGGGLRDDGYDDGSLGRVLGALVTGDRSQLRNDAEHRAMAESAGSGQYLISPELGSMVIDAARAQAAAFRAGALTLEMNEPIVYLPRLDGPVAAEWHVENDTLTGGDQTWSRVTLSAKTVVAGPLKVSRELWSDVDGNEVGRVLAADLSKQIALAIDKAVFEGLGTSGEPLGIVQTPNVGTLAMPGTDGSTPASYDEIVKAVYAVQAANGPMSTAAVMRPEVAEAYALLTDTLGQPLRRPQAIEQLPFLSTTQLMDDRTVGASDNASNAYIGDFSQVVVGFRPSVQVQTQLLQERYADTLSVALLAWVRCDVGVRRPEFLQTLTGVLPPA